MTDSDSVSPKTIAQLVCAATAHLKNADVEDPKRDARILLAHILDIDLAILLAYPEREVDDYQIEIFNNWIARRAAREPVSRILGHREFWSLPFAINDATLDPRPDSETLIQAVLDLLKVKDAPWRILDLGTGSGCLLLALIHELPQAIGLGIDISPQAVDQAKWNAELLGLEQRARFAVGNWAEDIFTPFDLVIANPPYLRDDERDALAPEVLEFDPAQALFAGESGLECYEIIIPQAQAILPDQGLLVLETGWQQGQAVAALCSNWGFSEVTILPDLNGKDRVVVAKRKKTLGKNVPNP